jgi:hypothetical protein
MAALLLFGISVVPSPLVQYPIDVPNGRVMLRYYPWQNPTASARAFCSRYGRVQVTHDDVIVFWEHRYGIDPNEALGPLSKLLQPHWHRSGFEWTGGCNFTIYGDDCTPTKPCGNIELFGKLVNETAYISSAHLADALHSMVHLAYASPTAQHLENLQSILHRFELQTEFTDCSRHHITVLGNCSGCDGFRRAAGRMIRLRGSTRHAINALKAHPANASAHHELCTMFHRHFNGPVLYVQT